MVGCPFSPVTARSFLRLADYMPTQSGTAIIVIGGEDDPYSTLSSG
eukprot:COSAG02_NODE_38785_length_425_cov_0.564417_2_plen_45_part_01